jgi:hypothetical protein
MKEIVSFIFFLFLLQSAQAQKQNFFRVYNIQGKKVNKGAIFQLSDTSVTLTRKNIFTETPVSQIKVIKSRRTTGHRVLVTTLSVVGVAVLFVGTIYSLAQPHRDYVKPVNNSSSNNRFRIKKPPKPEKKYKINGNSQVWQEQRKLLISLL